MSKAAVRAVTRAAEEPRPVLLAPPSVTGKRAKRLARRALMEEAGGVVVAEEEDESLEGGEVDVEAVETGAAGCE